MPMFFGGKFKYEPKRVGEMKKYGGLFEATGLIKN